MKRVFALLGAIGLIAAAVLVRGLIDGDIGGDDPGGGGSDAPKTEFTIVCVTELASVCDQLREENDKLAVRVEEAQTTLDTLIASDLDPAAAGFDGWLTVNPYPAQVTEQRERALLGPALGEGAGVLARSPMAIVGWNDRLEPLAAACGGTVSWRCIGEQAGQPWSSVGGQELWGAVKPGQANPAETATGLLTVSQATASYFGSSNFASNDFGDPAFEAWFSRLERAVPSYPIPPRTPLDDMLSLGQSTFDVAGSPEAIAAPAVARSRYSSNLTLLYPDPMVTADVVLVPLQGAPNDEDVSELAESSTLRAALLDGGWRVPGSPLPASADPGLALPDSDGLPRPGVVEALRDKWLEVTR